MLFSDALGPVPMPNSAVHHLASKSNGVEYQLFVGLPDDYKYTQSRYPVIYLLDGDFTFFIAQSMRPGPFLDSKGRTRKALIVAIGYKDQNLNIMTPEAYQVSFQRNRLRDYLPVKVDNVNCAKQEMLTEASQADLFYRFLQEELIPTIDQTYRTTDERMLGGMSLGGLFSLWTMIYHPQCFSGYLASSPAPWVEGGFSVEELRNLTYDQPVKLYLSVGSAEGSITDNCQAFANKIEILQASHDNVRRHDNVQAHFDILEGQEHLLACSIGLIVGIQHLFSSGQTE